MHDVASIVVKLVLYRGVVIIIAVFKITFYTLYQLYEHSNSYSLSWRGS